MSKIGHFWPKIGHFLTIFGHFVKNRQILSIFGSKMAYFWPKIVIFYKKCKKVLKNAIFSRVKPRSFFPKMTYKGYPFKVTFLVQNEAGFTLPKIVFHTFLNPDLRQKLKFLKFWSFLCHFGHFFTGFTKIASHFFEPDLSFLIKFDDFYKKL